MGATNCPETPRQKMISMMYLVYTALLALNVSTDVLNGFSVVQKSLRQSIESTEKKNVSLMTSLENMKELNPLKVGPALDKANEVKERSEALYQQVETIKYEIAAKVDGLTIDQIKAQEAATGVPYEINARDNLDVSFQIAEYGPTGATPGKGLGHALKDSIIAYASYVSELVKDDPTMVANIERNFDTSDKPNPKDPSDIQTWIVRTFEHMPVVATMTLMTKLQQDIRNTQSDVTSHLISSVDAGDFRVNKITAEVIPVSSYVTRGGKYEARIILAAVDSTAKPTIVVNGRKLEKDQEVYTAACGSTGNFEIKGEIRMVSPTGDTIPYPFQSKYIVGEPTAIISADLMNVFYAGIDNPVSISVPGIAAANINASASNGTLVKKGNGWSIKPVRVGQPCNITVSAKGEDGKTQTFPARAFRVKALPPPMAYIAYTENGVPAKYKGSKPFSKAYLVGAKGIKAELDDADLDVKYNVLGFDLNYYDSMGNTIVKTSTGTDFTNDQKDVMRKMSKGKKFYISRVRAKGPDGIEKILPPLEVIVN